MDLERLEKYVPHLFLVIIFAYMVWVRTLPYSDVVGEEGITFSANDPWYHIRVVEYLVENYPAVFSFDPWTFFPYGSVSSTGYGGLFDQIIATVALIVGLGDPSTRQVELVAAFAPAIFGAATAVPVYLLAKKITDRWTAILAPFSLALFSGQFLNRTTFANVQHQSAEAFFVGFAVLGFLIAVQRAYAEKPTVAHLKDMDWKPLSGAFVGAAGIAAYLLTWTPGIYIAVPLGLFVVVQMVRDHLNGRSTEYLALTSFFVFTLAAVPFLIYTLLLGQQYRITGTGFSMLQPIVLLGTGVGSLVLYYVSDYLQRKEYEGVAFPVVVAGIFVVGFVFLWLIGIASQFERLVRNMYTFGVLTPPGRLTIAEVQPASPTLAIQDFGLLIIVAAAGLVFLLIDVVRENNPVKMAVLFWSLNMFSAYFTQLRFGYYLAVAVAVLVGYSVYRVVQLVDLREGSWDSMEDIKRIKGYQLIAIVLVIFLFIPVNVVAVGNNPGMQPAWNSVNAGGNEPWQQEALPWMEANTPEISMEYHEGWSVPENEDFDYNVDESPLEGDYGVMSWWDYGHWIMHIGERVPNANPFQQGNLIGSLFFTSQSEERADLLLEAAPSVSEHSLQRMSNEELREIIENQDPQERYEDTRYVVIDDQMAAGKFGAIATWTGFEGYFERRSFAGVPGQIPALGARYDNTTLSRLYYDDASGMEGYRLVHETETYSLIGSRTIPGSFPRVNRVITRMPYDATLGDSNTTLDGLNTGPDDQTLPAPGGSQVYDFRGVASVKTYERVEGATITGQANVTNSTRLVVLLGLQTTNTDRPFEYREITQTNPDGSFEVTVPYPTEGDVSVEEGGTNASVEALSSYNIFVGEEFLVRERNGVTQIVGPTEEQGTVNVTETDIYMGNDVEIQLEEFNQTIIGGEPGPEGTDQQEGADEEGATDGGQDSPSEEESSGSEEESGDSAEAEGADSVEGSTDTED